MKPRLYDTKYLPTKLRVRNLGVSLSDVTNDNMHFAETQHMVVGEKTVYQSSTGSNAQYFNLIVDNEGVAINSSTPKRNENRNEYALYVDGNVLVTGRITSCNVINLTGGGVFSGSGATGGTGGFSPWLTVPNQWSTIYYDGAVTIGNLLAAQNTSNTLNIVDSADRTIDHAQISIQNTEASQLRLGIIGSARESPAVINTVPGVPLEFHMGRDQSYFNRTYYDTGIDTFGRPYSNMPLEVPNYYKRGRQHAPHIRVDPLGNVGIKTSENVPITYELRIRNPLDRENMMRPMVTTPMTLHVEGSMFASNVLIWDGDDERAQSLDSLFVRRKGVWIEACNIYPGPFAKGVYTFTSNTTIMGPYEDEYQFSVYGSQHITNELVIDEVLHTKRGEADDLLVYQSASFCNDVYMDQDLYVRESLRLYSGLYKPIYDAETCNTAWRQVQFELAGSAPSNINYFGGGITVPGQVGVGINPAIDEVNNMLVVRKSLANVFEIELMDRSSPFFRRTAFIGHLVSGDRPNDGSLFFVTPSDNDKRYNRSFTVGAPQNFYFYPGQDMGPYSAGIFTSSNPPVLGVFSSKRVGLNTYNPIATLDVRGGLAVSCNIRVYSQRYNEYVTLGVWDEFEVSDILPGSGDATYGALVYNNPAVQSVGIHTSADRDFGLTVAGGIKSLDGIYNGDGLRMMEWYDSSNVINMNQPIEIPSVKERMFTFDGVGIGVVQPHGMLDIKNVYVGPTVVNLHQNDRDEACRLDFIHTNDKSSWSIETNNNEYSINVHSKDPIRFNDAIICRYDTTTRKHRVVIGGDSNSLRQSNSNVPNPNAALIVGGHVSVSGDVNISGSFRINGTSYQNQGAIVDSRPPLENNDVFISGENIYFNPSYLPGSDKNKALFIGYTDTAKNLLTEGDNGPMLRVFQPDVRNSVICRFRSAGPTGFIEVIGGDANTNAFRFGYYNGNFGFFDANDIAPRPIFLLNQDAGEKRFGVNTDRPTAMFHAYQGTGYVNPGKNMLRLTRAVAVDTPGVSPELELEKNVIVDGTSKRWIFRGPDFSYDQKLMIQYGEGSTVETTIYKELFTFTKSGQLGIGNTTPEFLLDVKGVGKTGTLRLHSVAGPGEAPAPQIVLMSGSDTFGEDDLVDYRIYADTAGLTIEQQELSGPPKNLLCFGRNGNMGVQSTTTDLYTLTVGGTLNVTDTILLNGQPLFTSGTSLGDFDFDVGGRNVYLRPQMGASPPGGVIINSDQPTANIFHIFGIPDNGTLLVLDSDDSSCYINYRARDPTAANDQRFMYRHGTDHRNFVLAYNSNLTDRTIHVEAEGWHNALIIMPPSSNQNPNPNLPDFKTTLFGTLTMAAAEPVLRMKSTESTTELYTSIIGDLGGNIFLRHTNVGVGIGTGDPGARLHIKVEEEDTSTHDLLILDNQQQRRVLCVTDNGYVGIGTGRPSSNLHVQGNTYLDGHVHGTSNVYLAANLEVHGNSLVHGNSVTDSDIRLKHDLDPIKDALSKVQQLTGYTFLMNSRASDTGNPSNPDQTRSTGLIAQDVLGILPEAVIKGTDDYYGIAYGNMMGLIVEAIKDLAQKVDNLEKRIPA